MARVHFEIDIDFDADPRSVWDELVDWKGHEAWIPVTRVEVDGDDPTAVGATFVAWTGFGPLSLEDRMRVSECTWTPDSTSGYCEVEKLGPILRGRAGFTVKSGPRGSTVSWFEDVEVPRLPTFLSPIAAKLGAVGFAIGMRRLNKMLR